MGIVDDLMTMQGHMAADRMYWEKVWRDVVNLFMPYASRRFDYGGASIKGSVTGTYRNDPKATERSKEIYDSTAIWSGERLVAGVESLVTPRAQKWHSNSLMSSFGGEPNDIEEEWLDRLRDYQFSFRYHPQCGFALANQKAIRSASMLGTGILYSEENFGNERVNPVAVPLFYRHVSLIDIYMATNHLDQVDKAIEIREMTARQAVKMFEGRGTLSAKVTEAANDTKKQDTLFTFMHAVIPRQEADGYAGKMQGMEFASFWCEVETKHLIYDSGFFSFPYSVMWWDQSEGSAYGQSPPMAILSEVKMLQAMSRTAVQAGQAMVSPAMATMAGVYNNRLNLNPKAINPGYLNDQGVLKAQPLVTGANPSLAENLMEMKRQGIKEGLYIPLFQALTENPGMTATEALIRLNEKGEMLGPAGAKIEAGLASAADREIDIIGRKGAFEPESKLAPPPSIRDKEIQPVFTGPLAMMRKSKEAQGALRVLEVTGVLAQYDQGVIDRIDADATLELIRETNGAPRRMFRTDQEVAESRQVKAQQTEQAAALQAMDVVAGAVGKVTPAMAAVQQAA